MFPEHPSDPQPQRQRRRARGLAGTVVGVALLGALIGVAADRWAATSFGQLPFGASIPTITGPRIGPVAAPDGTSAQSAPASTTPTSSDPTEAAIQQVI